LLTAIKNEVKRYNFNNFIKSQQIANPDNLNRKKQQEIETKRKINLNLNAEQLRQFKQSVNSETELWKENLLENNWCNIGPKYKLDKFGLTSPKPSVQQPVWVHNKRKLLESLNFQERNIVPTEDPYLELNPCTYVQVYSYPRQVHNYPAVAQAFL
jgi:hypothetical protein